MPPGVVLCACAMMEVAFRRQRTRSMMRIPLSCSHSYAGEPWKASRFPVSARIGVRHLDGGDPFRVLVSKLGRHAQAHRISERIGEGSSAYCVASNVCGCSAVAMSMLLG